METPEHQHNQRCKEIFALLSQYLDLELPPDACREIEAHLTGCAPCEEFAETLRQTVDLCHRYRPTEMPAPLSETARDQLRAAYEKMRARKPAS